MKINKKTIFITAGIFIAVGILMTIVAMFLGGHAGVQISKNGIRSTYENGTEYILKRTEIDPFTAADIRVECADINIVPSDGYYLEYSMSGNSEEPQYRVEDDKFTFSTLPEVSISVFDFWEIDFTEEKEYYVNLYVPKDVIFSEFKVVNEYGDIEMEDISSKKGKFTVEFGDLGINQARVDACEITNEYGDIGIESFNGDSLKINSDFGDIEIGSAKLKTSDIRNEYGDVELTLAVDSSTYDYDLVTEYGSIHRGKMLMNRGSYEEADLEATYRTKEGKDGFIKIRCESGDITIDE